MNATPYRSALLLAHATVLGLIGMMVMDGAMDVAFLALAALPLALGAAAWRRHRRGADRGGR